MRLELLTPKGSLAAARQDAGFTQEATMIWHKIKTCVCAQPPVLHEVYLTKQAVTFFVDGEPVTRHWVVGPYHRLTKLAQELRVDKAVQHALRGACFGRRYTDLPPAGSRPSGGYRGPIEDERKRVEKARKEGRAAVNRLLTPVDEAVFKQRVDNPNTTPRISDEYKVVHQYYAKATLEAHHIVEKSILAELKCNEGDLKDKDAPCVLAFAELHKRLFTPEVGHERNRFTGMSSSQGARLLRPIYRALYSSPQMADLLKIAEIIIDHVQFAPPEPDPSRLLPIVNRL